MAQYGKSFVYNGISSEKYDLILGGFKVLDTTLNNSRTIDKGSMNKYRHTVNTWGVNYDDVLKFSIMIMKDSCKFTSHDELRFTREDIRQISAWLTSPVSPRLYHMYDYNDNTTKELNWEYDDEEHIYSASFEGKGLIYNFYCGEEMDAGTAITYATTYDELVTVSVNGVETETFKKIIENNEEIDVVEITYPRPVVTLLTEEPEYDYFGMFTNIEAADNNVYALQCDFECNTPFALSSIQSVTNVVDGSLNNEISVWNYSDEREDYVYPIITIIPKSSYNPDIGEIGQNQETEDVAPDESQSIRITNKSDGNRSIQLNNLNPQDVLIMDCGKLTITNNDGNLLTFEDMNVGAIDYIYFPRLLYGENIIEISGNAEITFTYRYPVKVGAY